MRKAGFMMLPVVDPDGQRTGRQAVSHTLGLLPVSLCPFLFQMAGPIYLVGALRAWGWRFFGMRSNFRGN